MGSSGDITQLLREWQERKLVDSNELFRLVSPQLHKISSVLMRGERPGHMLQTTGLVHELFLRLVRQRKLDFNDREHFYSFAARLMRRVLVDYARERDSLKRDGGQRVPLHEDLLWTEWAPANILDLDRALDELEALDERKCRMVEMRFVIGFTAHETADLMGVSKASVDRDLRFARGWLSRRLEIAEQN